MRNDRPPSISCELGELASHSCMRVEVPRGQHATAPKRGQARGRAAATTVHRADPDGPISLSEHPGLRLSLAAIRSFAAIERLARASPAAHVRTERRACDTTPRWWWFVLGSGVMAR
jgi:hypothetical protein